MQLKNGDIFAEHYQLKKLLGVGSFGEVWLARNILADVDVAIKLYGLLDDNGIKAECVITQEGDGQTCLQITPPQSTAP